MIKVTFWRVRHLKFANVGNLVILFVRLHCFDLVICCPRKQHLTSMSEGSDAGAGVYWRSKIFSLSCDGIPNDAWQSNMYSHTHSQALKQDSLFGCMWSIARLINFTGSYEN